MSTLSCWPIFETSVLFIIVLEESQYILAGQRLGITRVAAISFQPCSCLSFASDAFLQAVTRAYVIVAFQ